MLVNAQQSVWMTMFNGAFCEKGIERCGPTNKFEMTSLRRSNGNLKLNSTEVGVTVKDGAVVSWVLLAVTLRNLLRKELQDV